MRSAVALQLERTKECAGCPAFTCSAMQHVSGHSQQERTLRLQRLRRQALQSFGDVQHPELHEPELTHCCSICCIMPCPVPRLPCSVTRLKATFPFLWSGFEITSSIAFAPDIVSATAEYSCN